MTLVQTIRGPVDSSDLGRTLSHEHLTNGTSGMERIPGLLDHDAMVERCVAALVRAKQAGIDSLIDLTPFDLGRQMWLFERVADRAEVEVNVVCCTGVYRWVPPIYFAWDEDEIAAHFLREIEEGIEGTPIRAAIIKLAWDLEYRLDEPVGAAWTPRAMLERTARGAARAAKHAGVPISCHTRAADQLGIPLLDLFEEEGLDLRAVTIGHSNDSQDQGYLRTLAGRGATVGLDRFFTANEQYVEQRSSVALGLVQAGYAEQVSLGHDASPAGLWGRWRIDPTPDCWTLVPEHEVPWLLAHGATEDDIDAMLRRSIHATFETAAAMPAGARAAAGER
jgi:phosphotriesterase-related protein